jgi:uncharacterized glyoxalase superfamily protein PhnB
MRQFWNADSRRLKDPFGIKWEILQLGEGRQ